MKEIENMENKLKNLLNIELLKRAFSAIIFIPLVLVPFFLSNYLLAIIFIIINSVVLIELKNMVKNNKFITPLILYSTIATFSFFLFIMITICDPQRKSFILELLITIWIFDTFSYIGGKLIGGKKIFPKISEGKTYSGLSSGIIFTLLFIHAIKIYISDTTLISIIITLLIISAAFLGDLVASVIKRNYGIKDASNIMPGHGGLYDRFDSFIMVMFLYGILLLIL